MLDKDEILPHSHIDGRPATVGEVWKIGLDHLAEACGAFYDIETEEGIAAAIMADSAFRYANAIFQDRDPRSLECEEEEI